MELFRSHCYSTIYCNSLWSRFKLATLNRLKVCHNDILKRLLGLPRWCSSSLAFARNGVNNLDVIRRHSVFSLNNDITCSRAHGLESSEFSTIWPRLQCHSLTKFICAVYLSPNSSDNVKFFDYLTTKVEHI
ncbi:hypothetical protein GWK47_022450 [Chionoecetes opilio]|uniref:Uncharacterized protein n=1 Tax=Chionoecetes opilio TaxID=41210 RepID=A0A8J4XWX2_CHIOP|nr:hypothetical protein GWK47_022450 [Chionoecetes opilio]